MRVIGTQLILMGVQIAIPSDQNVGKLKKKAGSYETS